MTPPSSKSKYQERILVIDDESVICRSCREILDPEGYYVETCQDPEEGLKKAGSLNYDVILIDVVMPQMDGLTLLDRIKESATSSEVVIMTGYSTIQNAVDAMKRGAFDYVSKPFTPDELRIVIKKTLERSALIRENMVLRNRLQADLHFEGLIGQSAPMENIFKLIQRVAPMDGTVLITGESGTGKEMIAHAIHRLSPRNSQAFVACDCSSLAATLLESELFGHVKGSFSGAIATKQGLFEIADRGTLFLDEIANISLETQNKLLRVLETQRVKKVGDIHEKQIDIRLIAATNRNLHQMIAKGSFREDLFYRLNVIPVHVPPLRDRQEDIAALATAFLEHYRRKYPVKAQMFSPETMQHLENYPWPGNVRELKNVVERMAMLCDATIIPTHCLPRQIRPAMPNSFNHSEGFPKKWEDLKAYKSQLTEKLAREIERRFITESLRRHGGNVSRAAREVGMQRTNFHALMRKYGINAGDIKPD